MGKNRWLRNGVVYLLVIVGVIVIFYTLLPSFGASNDVPLTTVVAMAKNDEIREIAVDGRKLTITPNVSSRVGSDRLYSRMGSDTDVINLLVESGVEIGPPSGVSVTFEGSSGLSSLLGLLLNFLPLIIFGGLILFMMRQAQGSNNQTMSFGRSRARMAAPNRPGVTFADVAGVEEAKAELQEVVEFLRYPERFLSLGARIPKGVLLVGQPGTGKTLLARAVAGEAGVPFFHISGSEFVEMFVGVGAARVRDLFDQAKRNAPCIVFVDEIDAVGRHRGAGLGGGHDEREQTLNQILVEMDGFEPNNNVIVLAATNRPDVLDPALLRPGRFDRQVTVGLPDIRGREHILGVHLRKVPLADDVKPQLIARGTPGFSGADLANLVNEAALFAARRNKRLVGMEELELAKDKIMMGAERKSMVMTDKEKLNTAYHEAGHAIIGLVMPEHDPVYKVTIIPRGRALGVTMFLPEEDRYSLSRQQIISQICSLFGGRIAEEMTLGANGVTTGASNDIKRATELAHNMVAKWGLSDEMGPIMYDEDESHQFLGGPGQGGGKLKSGETTARLDKEVRKIIDECYEQARQILHDNRDKLDAMAEALMKFETIDASQLKDIMEGRDPRPPEGWNDGDSSGGGMRISDDKPEAKADDQAPNASSDEGEEGDDEPRRRPSDPLGGPAGP